MKIQKDSFTFRVSPELLEQYQRHCEEAGITASADLRQYMKDALMHRMELLKT